MSWVPTWVWIMLTIALWAASAYAWCARFDALADRPWRPFLLDWHVYAAGGRDLVEGDLYHAPLRSGFHIPVDQLTIHHWPRHSPSLSCFSRTASAGRCL